MAKEELSDVVDGCEKKYCSIDPETKKPYCKISDGYEKPKCASDERIIVQLTDSSDHWIVCVKNICTKYEEAKNE